MRKTAIPVPPGSHRREFGGRLLYSHAVIAEPGRLMFISGQLSRNAEGVVIGVGDMEAQVRQVYANLSAVLESAGATLDHLVATTTYATDLDAYFRVADVRSRLFESEPPTSTAVGVQALSQPDFLVEVAGVAVLD